MVTQISRPVVLSKQWENLQFVASLFGPYEKVSIFYSLVVGEHSLVSSVWSGILGSFPIWPHNNMEKGNIPNQTKETRIRDS